MQKSKVLQPEAIRLTPSKEGSRSAFHAPLVIAEQFIEGRMETSALPPLNTDVDLTHITNQVERAS